MKTLQRNLAEFAARLELNSAPDELPWIAKRALIDTIGVMQLGAKHPDIHALKKLYGTTAGHAPLVGGGAAEWEEAALINGTAAHVWDFDDTSYTGIMHGSAVIVPALLATAAYCKCSSDDVVTSFIAGSEVAYTLAEILGHGHYFRGWWSTATLGMIGATVAVARLLSRDPGVIEAALGLACAASSGSKKAFGTSAKPYLVGDAARRAIAFNRMVGAGLTGPTGALEGKGAFLDLFSEATFEVDAIGSRWRLKKPGLLQKSYPVCSAAHAATDLMIELVETLGITAQNLESIIAEVPDLVAKSLVFGRPTTQQEAQFCLPYALSCAIVSGGLSTKDLDEQEFCNELKRNIMDKISMFAVDDLSSDEMRALYPESARLRVTMKDGTCVTLFCGEAYGMPNRPFSDEDLASKFGKCVDRTPPPMEYLKTADIIIFAEEIFSMRARCVFER